MTNWHIVTGEYPPAHGGVSDYSHAVAGGLAAAGDAVHVWCPASTGASAPQAGVQVHPIAGSWSAADLHRLDREMDAVAGGRRLLLQWVPHAFGKRSLNLRFCRWMRRRAKSGDVLDIMVHEPGLAFREGTMRQDMAAGVHRLMLTTLLSGARRAWVAIPAWADVLRPWALGRSDLTFGWLPVPSTLPVAPATRQPANLRAARLETGDVLIGHFGTYQPAIRRSLCELLPSLLRASPEVRVELLGRGGDRVVDQLRATLGSHAARVTATGELNATELSLRLQACDLLVQPYPDGVSTRRTTLMAALAHGVPVVTTLGRLSEPFWRNSDAIVAVQAGDADALARAAQELVRRPDRRRHLGSMARALYEERFSLPHVIDALRADACGAAV